MSARGHAAYERALVRIVTAADPAEALARAARDRRLPATLRRALAAADADGVRLTALLVARLRFERLLSGSAEAAAWFERDPRGFHRRVPPLPRCGAAEAEARAWEAWNLGSNLDNRWGVRPPSTARPARAPRRASESRPIAAHH